MFAKKKKKIDISAPSNFQHRVHTGFDSNNGKFVGLPKQWTSLVGKSPHRPKPMLDPSAITPVEVEEMEEVEEENRDQVNCDEEDNGGDTVNFRRGGRV